MITIQDIENLKREIDENIPEITNENMTIDFCIKPLIRLLNYTKPSELKYQYPCYESRGKFEAVDIALLKNNKPIILIECKNLNEQLSNYTSQLKRYFESQQTAKYGILTNGREYHFYTDFENLNLMDKHPCLIYNINKPWEGFDSLKKFYNDDNLDLGLIRKDAEKNLIIQIIKGFLAQELKSPSEEFTRFVIKQTSQTKQANRNIITQYQNYIIEAYKDINEPVIIDGPPEPPQPGRGEKKPRTRKEYFEAGHLRYGSPETVKLYHIIKQRLLKDFNLTIDYKKEYIAFKAKTNVTDIEIQKKQLKLYLNIKKGLLKDSRQLCKDISEVGHYGNGDYQILLTDDKELDYVMTLVKQVIQYQESKQLKR